MQVRMARRESLAYPDREVRAYPATAWARTTPQARVQERSLRREPEVLPKRTAFPVRKERFQVLPQAMEREPPPLRRAMARTVFSLWVCSWWICPSVAGPMACRKEWPVRHAAQRSVQRLAMKQSSGAQGLRWQALLRAARRTVRLACDVQNIFRLPAGSRRVANIARSGGDAVGEPWGQAWAQMLLP